MEIIEDFLSSDDGSFGRDAAGRGCVAPRAVESSLMHYFDLQGSKTMVIDIASRLFKSNNSQDTISDTT